MKKVLIAFGAFAMFSLASCSKDYTCTCEVDGESIPEEYNGVDKDAAEEACNNREAIYKNEDPDATCSLD